MKAVVFCLGPAVASTQEREKWGPSDSPSMDEIKCMSSAWPSDSDGRSRLSDAYPFVLLIRDVDRRSDGLDRIGP